MAQRDLHTSQVCKALKWRVLFFFFPVLFFPIGYSGFGSSSINSTTSTGSSAGVNFTHLLQKQPLPFAVGIFLLSWVYTICKFWSWSVQVCNFEKDTEIFHVLLVAVLWTVLFSSFLLSFLVTSKISTCTDIFQKYVTKLCPQHLGKTWSMYEDKVKNSQQEIFFSQLCLIFF